MSAGCFADAARTLAGVSALALGWRPDEFWRATPDELVAALGGFAPASTAPLDASALTALCDMFPDLMESPNG